MGKLLPPVDITNNSSLSELDKRISIGPVLVFVYADWCGHCQKFKPMMDKLESAPNRTIQTARVRDDVFPKSSISNAKIEGYPTLLLIKKNGNAVTFKDKQGNVTNAIPEHTDMNKMMSIVRNAGTPQGVSLLNSPNAAENVEEGLNVGNNSPNKPTTIIVNTEPTTVDDAVADSTDSTIQSNIVGDRQGPTMQGGSRKMQGGGLWSHLLAASQNVAPAAALFLASSMVNTKKGKRKVKKTRRKAKN